MISLSKWIARTNRSAKTMVIEPEMFDDHKASHEHMTIGQTTLFLMWLAAVIYYIVHRRKREPAHAIHEHADAEIALKSSKETSSVERKQEDGVVEGVKDSEAKGTVTVKRPSSAPPETSLDSFLQHVCIFGLLMFFFYMCEYKKVIPLLGKEYDRDVFLFLVFLLFLVGCCFTIKPTTDVILGRDQTEEWKGWMQVMFVWYHYFAAKEWYNWIRIYIACYVWMTGFGNFSFFWVKKDFSMWRMMKMLFRLNFLVLFVCIVTKNEYMLYYICAMHTYWFLTVYLFMRVLSSWNGNRVKMAIKFGAYIVCNALLFEIPDAIATVFRPLWFIFQFHDGRHDIMHEWQFRLGLDHWACMAGMLCAYNYPYFESLLRYLEDAAGSVREQTYKKLTRVGMVIVSLAVCVTWYFTCMTLDKLDYNKIHPYTSFIPILAYIVLRNSFPILRKYHVHLFAWLGKITLETYLSQLHIYLQSNAKDLLGYFFVYSSHYRLLNFALATIIYLFVSYILYRITNIFSSFLIPKDMKLLFRYVLIGATGLAASIGLSFILKFCSLL